MRVAKRIATARPTVLFVAVGADRIAYGNDLRHIQGRSFRAHVLARERPDLDQDSSDGSGICGPLTSLNLRAEGGKRFDSALRTRAS